MIVFRKRDIKRIPHIIKKYKNSDELFGLNYNGTVYLDRSIPDKSDDITLFITVIMALNRKDLYKRYSFIYDYMCDNLDSNGYMCEFKCDKCLGNRCHTSVHKKNGCCYKNGEICPLLVNHKCSIKCLSCKLFMCSSVEKKYKLKTNLNNYPLLKYFFNYKQRQLITYNFRVDEEEFINELIKIV